MCSISVKYTRFQRLNIKDINYLINNFYINWMLKL